MIGQKGWPCHPIASSRCNKCSQIIRLTSIPARNCIPHHRLCQSSQQVLLSMFYIAWTPRQRSILRRQVVSNLVKCLFEVIYCVQSKAQILPLDGPTANGSGIVPLMPARGYINRREERGQDKNMADQFSGCFKDKKLRVSEFEKGN